MMNITLQEIEEGLKANNYIPNEEVVYAVYTALKLGKPILIEGMAGTGKTELAKVLSKMFQAKLIRLQCYEGIDFSKVLYEVDYPKKLFRQVLFNEVAKSDIEKISKGKKFADIASKLEDEMGAYGEEYIIQRPVYEAINPENKYKKVLLVELDKADSEVENLLLETLSDYSISIPEVGTIECDPNNKPIVVLTSNALRDLSEPLKRRAIYLYLEYPSVETEMQILVSKANVTEKFAEDVAKLVADIRSSLNLKQNPSIAESIEWANVLFNHLKVDEISRKFLREIKYSLNTLSKNRRDTQKISTFLDSNVS